MQMFRSIGVGVILSIVSGLGSSLLATFSKITALELQVAVLQSQVQALTRGSK